jgi:NADPH2:quinone reductase
MMRALVCRAFGPAGQLVIEERPEPRPGPGEAVIAVRAAALNFPDTLAITGKYQIRSEPPFIPGGEAAGVVIETGTDVEGVKPGDRVIYMGANGAFAETISVPVDSLIGIPEAMDFRTAAAFGVTYATGYHALKQRAVLKPAETLLVLGAGGGVGLAAVNLGAAMGARVIAAASTGDKLELARTAGACECINYAGESLRDRVKEITGGAGVDVVYDPVGGDLSEQALRVTAWDGRFLVVGFASGEIPKLPLNLPLLKGCSVVGVFLGAWRARDPDGYRRNFDELFALYAAGRIRPLISRVLRLEDYAEAFALLTGRQAQGKVVFSLGQD